MKKIPPAATPAAYVAALTGWRRTCVTALRSAVRASALEERIKWGNIVYLAGGPVLMIRAEPERVLLGFWRGQRLTGLEPRLRPGGMYEMATLSLRDGDVIDSAHISALTAAAVQLNAELGDPTDDATSRRR